jgi:DNA-binding XRE family transcriptional regulator
MKYVYLEITEQEYDGERPRLERTFCGIRMYHLAAAIGCTRTTIYKWERNGVTTGTTQTAAYQRIMRGIHNHASLDYWPCPTLIKMVPDKWSKTKLSAMTTMRRWYK